VGFHPTFNEDTSLTIEVQGDPLASLNLAPIKRAVPLTDERVREMAKELARESVRPATHHEANLRTIMGRRGR
jgi:hypothetical protein